MVCSKPSVRDEHVDTTVLLRDVVDLDAADGGANPPKVRPDSPNTSSYEPASESGPIKPAKPTGARTGLAETELGWCEDDRRMMCRMIAFPPWIPNFLKWRCTLTKLG